MVSPEVMAKQLRMTKGTVLRMARAGRIPIKYVTREPRDGAAFDLEEVIEKFDEDGLTAFADAARELSEKTKPRPLIDFLNRRGANKRRRKTARE